MSDKDAIPDVSIVMPCMNEAQSLSEAIDTAKAALGQLEEKGFTGEIIISDNGSTDDSQDIARQRGCRVVLAPTRGYGRALIAGISASRGRYIVMGDSDASYDFRESMAMIQELSEGYELCMGSRFKGKIMPGAMPWKNRWIGNPVLTGILNLFFRSRFSDAHCGLRAFTKKAFEKMELTSPGMEFASEMVVKAALLNLKRTEVPVTLYPDNRGRSPHLRPWRDGWRHLKFLLVYCPLWCFIVPSLLAVIFGSLLLTALLLTPPDKNFWIGPIWFGDHWLIVAASAIILGYHLWISGMTAIVYYSRKLSSPPNRFVSFAKRFMTIGNMCAVGTTLIIVGLIAVGYVFMMWTEAGFGQLNMIRLMTVGMTLLTIGVQSFFSGFLVSIMREDVG
jgi:glycosyltransferase involved in cell wall biosynthesis